MGSLCDSLWATPDSRRLVAHDINGTVQIWDTRSRAIPVRYFSVEGSPKVHVGSLDPSGERLATVSGDGFFRLWDTATGEVILKHPTGDKAAVADFDWDSRVLALGFPDGTVRSFRLTRDADLEAEGEWKLASRIWLVRVSPSGKICAGTERGEVGVISGGESEMAQQKLGSWVTAAAFGPGDTLVVGTLSGAAVAWQGGQFGKPIKSDGGKFHEFVFAPGGELLAGLQIDGGVKVWEVGDFGNLKAEFKHAARANDDTWQARQRLVFDGDRRLHTTTCFDNRTMAWDVESGEQAWEGLPQRYVEKAIAINPATNELYGMGLLWIRDLHSGRLIADKLDHSFRGGDRVQAMSFASDGRILAIPGNSGSIRLHHLPAVPSASAEPWFLDFAENWVGAKVGADGNVRLIPISQRLAAKGVTPPGKGEPVQREIAEWLLAEPEERAVAPGSTVPMRAALDSLARQPETKAADSVLWHRPADPQAMLTLAKELRAAYPFPVVRPMAKFYAGEAARLGDAEIKRQAVEVLKR